MESDAAQETFDALYYDLDVDLNPTTSRVTGSVRMDATAFGASIDLVELDLLDNMTVDSVRGWGACARARERSYRPASAPPRRASSYCARLLPRHRTSGSVGRFYAGDPMTVLSELHGAQLVAVQGRRRRQGRLGRPQTVPSIRSRLERLLVGVDSVSVLGKKMLVAREAPDLDVSRLAAHPYTVFSKWYHYSPTDLMEIRTTLPDNYAW
jgi:hypothetical protein